MWLFLFFIFYRVIYREYLIGAGLGVFIYTTSEHDMKGQKGRLSLYKSVLKSITTWAIVMICCEVRVRSKCDKSQKPLKCEGVRPFLRITCFSW